MTDAEAFALLDLIADDGTGERLAHVVAAFVEERKWSGDLLAVHRVRDRALAITQSRALRR